MNDESPLIPAQQQFIDQLPNTATGSETVPLAQALGRTLYSDLTATEDAPPYHRAIVEGFVVLAAGTAGATEDAPVSFTVAGSVSPGDDCFPALQPGEAYGVATGSILPDGPVAVVRMWEAKRDGNSILVSRPFPPRFFVEDQGSETPKGATVLAAGSRISPADIGTIASFGIDEVTVARAPRVTLFASGDEVVPHTEPGRPGIIRDCNTPMLAAAVTQAGGIPVEGGIMADDFDGFVAAVKTALAQSDMVVIAGGTAVGGRDFVSDLLKEVGQLIVDGVPMRSGRPLIMGQSNGKPLVCVAGHPPEALRGFHLFGSAAIDRLCGRDAPLPQDD